MAALAVLLLAAALGLTVYALWPRQRSQFSFSVDDANPARVLYARTAHGWNARWNQRWEYTGARAGNPSTVGRVMAAAIAAGFLAGAAATGSPILGLLLAAGTAAGPWVFLGSQSDKRERVITGQLVDFLDSVRASMETETPEAAIRTAAGNADAPLRHELAGLVSDLDARVNLSVALQSLARRNSSRAMAFTCATLDMAKRTGSSEIATNLTELAKLIRNNERTAQDIKNKTLILRVSAKMFAVVPALAVAFSMLSFGVEPWLTPLGYAAIAVIVAIATGAMVGFRRLQKWQVGV
jgi:Flp pilus assembly protein TadB